MPTPNVSKKKKTSPEETENDNIRRVLRSSKQKPLPSERDVIFDSASVTVGGEMDSDVNSSSCDEPISKKRKLRKKDPESDADSNFGYDSEDVNASDTAIEGNRSEFQMSLRRKSWMNS